MLLKLDQPYKLDNHVHVREYRSTLRDEDKDDDEPHHVWPSTAKSDDDVATWEGEADPA